MKFSSTAVPELVVVDMFCGAGGITTGLTQACRELGIQPKIIAINHWNIAIETHNCNHPEATHWCERVDSLDPRKLTPDGRIDFLIAASECIHQSIARGGKPINDQSRASAWQVVRYAEALSPRHILLENVREFSNWGPLCANNKRPLKSRRGQTFAAFLGALESLGYTVSGNFGTRPITGRLQPASACLFKPNAAVARSPGRRRPTRKTRTHRAISFAPT